MLPVLSAKRTPLPFSETQFHPLDGSTPPAARLIRTSLDKLAEALIDPPEPHTKANISELDKAKMMSPMLEAFRVQGPLVVMAEMEIEFGYYYTEHLEHRTHWKHSLAQAANERVGGAAVTEGQAVGRDQPQQRHQARNSEAVHHH